MCIVVIHVNRCRIVSLREEFRVVKADREARVDVAGTAIEALWNPRTVSKDSDIARIPFSVSAHGRDQVSFCIGSDLGR